MGINIPEVERQKASKALNCDRQCPHIGSLADIEACPRHVRFTPKSGHSRSASDL
jgi:hypothetical protein